MIGIGGVENEGVCQHHVTLLGDHRDRARPVLLVQDGVQRRIELVGLQPLRLRLPEDAGGQVMRALDEQRATAAGVHRREAEEVE